MITERNLTYLYVGNVESNVANNSLLNVDALANSSVAIVDVTSGKGTTGAISAGNKYQIVNKLSDGTIVRSPIFGPESITYKGKFEFTPAVEQVSYMGYNGTAVSGLGTLKDGQGYSVTLSMNNTRGVYMQESEKKIFSAVYTTAGGEKGFVKDLMESFVALFNYPHQSAPVIEMHRVTDGSKGAVSSAVVYKLTRGSTEVKSLKANLTGQAISITAGTQILHIPSTGGTEFSFTAVENKEHKVYIGEEIHTGGAVSTSAANVAKAIADAINANSKYATAAVSTAKVTVTYIGGFKGLPPVVINDSTVAVTIEEGDTVSSAYDTLGVSSGDTFHLDVPWQGASGYVKSGTEAGEMGIVTATKWGLQFTGIPQPFNPQSGYPVQVSFDVASTLPVQEYKAKAASMGSGGWQALAELESYAQGHEVWYKRSNYPTPEYRQEVLRNAGYDVITVACANTYNISTTGTNVSSPFTMTIAINNSIASYDGLATVLDV